MASAASAGAPGGASSSSTSRPGRRRRAATWSRTKTPRPGAPGPGAMSEITSARIAVREATQTCHRHVWIRHTDVRRLGHPTRWNGRHEMGYRLMGRLHAAALTAPRGDAGQGTVEYVGLILLIAAVLAAVVLASRKPGDNGIAKILVTKLTQAIDGLKPPSQGG